MEDISIAISNQNRIFCGDTLFTGSVGRTDLPGGSHQQLTSKIREHILTLPDNTLTYPGHGPSSTIQTEKLTNPYFEEPS